jgi:hypothetical protein
MSRVKPLIATPCSVTPSATIGSLLGNKYGTHIASNTSTTAIITTPRISLLLAWSYVRVNHPVIPPPTTRVSIGGVAGETIFWGGVNPSRRRWIGPYFWAYRWRITTLNTIGFVLHILALLIFIVNSNEVLFFVVCNLFFLMKTHSGHREYAITPAHAGLHALAHSCAGGPNAQLRDGQKPPIAGPGNGFGGDHRVMVNRPIDMRE